MRKFKIISLTLILVVILSGSVLALNKGDEFPDLEVSDLKGNPVKTADYFGEYTLFDIWASWCGPCQRALNSYQENIEKFTGAGINLVAISVDNNISAARKFAGEHNLSFTVLHDGTGQMPAKLGVRGIPTMFLVEPGGKVISIKIGFNDFDSTWEEIITAVEDDKKQ